MEALALFGSQISGDLDANSDRDLLVVCPQSEKRTQIRKFTDIGYSVAAYTPRQLICMRNRGSLFLQHLKFESKILFDPNKDFLNFLNSCVLVSPSDAEMNKCAKSILHALAVPRTDCLSLWLVDHLYVLSRDFLIKYFARKGIIVFNINQLASCMLDEFDVSENEVFSLSWLRRGKYIYRSGSTKFNFGGPFLQRWIDTILRVVNCIEPKALPLSLYLNQGFSSGFESNYELLRYIESLRILFPGVGCDLPDDKHISKIIKNPNLYSSTSVLNAEYLRIHLNAFRKKANKSLQRTGISAAA